jgi:hypothetical protein
LIHIRACMPITCVSGNFGYTITNNIPRGSGRDIKLRRQGTSGG